MELQNNSQANKTEFNINRPWLTLDPWQKEYVFDPNPNQNNFLLCARQCGKTTAMSMRAVELCVHYFQKGEFVLINSITEKQAYHLLAKARAYAEEKYLSKIDYEDENKPTMHRLIFKNGAGILCFAAGETGEGLRGYTIKKLMPDEGSRMSEEYFIAVLPMISVTGGSIDIASTPFGKKNKDGSDKFFYKCSLDDSFKKYYVSAENCPRHRKEFLKERKEKMSKLSYAQEFEAVFTDELLRVFSEELIKKCCVLSPRKLGEIYESPLYLGIDVAGLGQDLTAISLFNKLDQFSNETISKALTTEVSAKILDINLRLGDKLRKIGIDDGGIGYGVWSELRTNSATRRKVEALNNASRPIDKDGEKSKKLLKEEMYINLLILMEQGKVRLLNDEEVKASLASMQFDEEQKVFGSNSHIAESIIRAVWLASESKGLNNFIMSF